MKDKKNSNQKSRFDKIGKIQTENRNTYHCIFKRRLKLVLPIQPSEHSGSCTGTVTRCLSLLAVIAAAHLQVHPAGTPAFCLCLFSQEDGNEHTGGTLAKIEENLTFYGCLCATVQHESNVERHFRG